MHWTIFAGHTIEVRMGVICKQITESSTQITENQIRVEQFKNKALIFAKNNPYDMEDIILDSIDKYNKLYGLETLHPLVTVIDLNKATSGANHFRMHYGLYAIFLKNSTDCVIKYGRKNYDYQEGTIVSFAPGQTAEVTTQETVVQHNVYGILFHPDLIRGTSLAQNIRNYNFFSYSSNESLHLSEREKEIVMDCLKNIQAELNHAIDKHSKALIASNIELLLNYCLRFYERQFITREKSNMDVLQQFENQIKEYLDSERPKEEGLPSVKFFAEKAFLTPNYFGDLVKRETGKSAQEYIQFKIIERAKDKLKATNLTISEVAYELGYNYPQHFSRIFKNNTGMTPNKYRTAH